MKAVSAIEFEHGKHAWKVIAQLVDDLVEHVHALNKTWWKDPKTGEYIERNVPEMIALEHSELSEALEAYRKDLDDDKLPHFKGEVVELADCIIRILDHAGGRGLPLGQALAEKLEYNKTREDHKPENRLKQHGKKF